MPLYEIFQRSNCKNRGVYEYPDENSFRRFMMMFPDVGNLLYNEINEERAGEIQREIKEKLKKRVAEIMFELWGQHLLEE